MAEKDLQGLSDDELLEAWTDHVEELEEAKARNKEFSAEFHKRESQKALSQRLGVNYDDLSDDQKGAITALAQGIPSEESVNNG